jgi:hypothetical protein
MNSTTLSSPPDQKEQCQLISQGFFSVIIQSSLALVSLLSLYVKWKLDSSKEEQRDFNVWSLDALKQGCAAFAAHIENIIVAILLSATSHADDECSAYLVNFLFNILAGFPLVWVLLRTANRAARKFHWHALERRGYYGNPFNTSVFLVQCLEWTLIVCSAKLLASVPLFIFSRNTIALGRWLLRPFEKSPRVELLVVMILVPSLLNVLQVLVFDNFIKLKRRAVASSSVHQEMELEEEAVVVKKNETSPLLRM